MDMEMYERARTRLRDIMSERKRLEARLDSLEIETNEYEGFLAVWDRLRPEPTRPSTAASVNTVADPDLDLKDAAVFCFRQDGKVMKSRELAERLLALGMPYDKDVESLDASLRGMLTRNTDEDGGPFKRFQRGVYGLAEWNPIQQALAGAEVKAPGPDATDPGGETEQEGFTLD